MSLSLYAKYLDIKIFGNFPFEVATERIQADDAATLLLRRDDYVDYQTAWQVIREMNSDEKYKEEVLRAVHQSPDAWW